MDLLKLVYYLLMQLLHVMSLKLVKYVVLMSPLVKWLILGLLLVILLLLLLVVY